MLKIAVFLDYANVNAASRDNDCRIDFGSLLYYLADETENRKLLYASAYVPIDPRQEHARDAVIDHLWSNGYIVKTKVGIFAGESYKCDFDVEITIDMMQIACELKPDIIVLVSGDNDFVPVVLNIRNRGIRVEVAAFDNSMSNLLAKRCSGYIVLDKLRDQETTTKANYEHNLSNEDYDYECKLSNEDSESTTFNN
jgi:uncharacterized LabA/DUF88 family protein